MNIISEKGAPWSGYSWALEGEPTAGVGPGRIETLQVGRAVAALAVAAAHAIQAAGSFAEPVPAAVHSTLIKGHLGVDFFFVLSGFIILHAHRADPRTPEAFYSYAWKRLTRIYVPYLPVVCAMMMVYIALPQVSGSDRQWGVVSSLTLLPLAEPPALAVAWTLVHEVMFYAVFAVSYFTRHFAAIVVGWVAAIGLVWIAEPAWVAGNPASAMLLHPLNLEFIAGMIAAACVPYLSARMALPLFGLSAIATVAFFINARELHRVVFGVGLAPLVAGLALWERDARLRIPRFVLLLGGASYALYLLHSPAASAVARLTKALGSWQASVALCLLVGIIASIGYHLYFELPLLKRLRAWYRAMRTVRDQAARSHDPA